MRIKRLALALFIALSVILPAGIIVPSLPTAPEPAAAACNYWITQPFINYAGSITFAGWADCGSSDYRTIRVAAYLYPNTLLISEYRSGWDSIRESVFCNRNGNAGPYGYKTMLTAYDINGYIVYHGSSAWKWLSGGPNGCYY